MQINSVMQPSCAGVGFGSRRFRASRLAVALAAAGLLAAGSVNAGFIYDSDLTNEPDNNTLGGATQGGAGDTFLGCVGPVVPASGGCTSVLSPDDIDFVKFINLVSGATYDLVLSSGFGFVDFDLVGNPSSAFDQTITPPNTGSTLTGLTGLTSLTLGVHVNVHGQPNMGEGYSAFLTKTADASVPEPASVALLAAGLGAALVARRRKRT